MSRIFTKKNKYSKVQYFFWLLSGAEISILKDCPTDYNRQAGIGFTIFMTTLLALISGSYAGYYFGESYLSAAIFGTIWASLIFSIDRSMVVTLKKDLTKEKQDFWPAFLSRAVLAILIAFIISIPLELLIFKENIDLHMDKYKLDQVYYVQQASRRNEAISDKQRILSNDSLVLGKVETQLSQGEPQGDLEYDRLKSDIQSKQNEYDALLSNLNIARTEANNAYNSVPTYYDYSNETNVKNRDSQQWRTYENKLALRNQAQGNLNKYDKKGLDDLKKQRQDYITNWITDLKIEQKRVNQNIIQTSTSINKGLAIADTSKNEFQHKIQDKKGFVLRFMVLENLATPNNSEIPEGATILMLLWLIRILFFTIEILPTIAKIATPIGAYDRAIYRKEKDLELELEERTSEYLKQQKALRDIEYRAEQDQTKERTEIENSLHKELLNEIATAQNKIARQKIDEFKKKHNAD
ncbi:MAG: DUF4407 domain-containing protein [Dysgonomonas sp.]|uniref:DUF4407 domain-containing protein n=1 Tax=Dysgonomonas sp. TaxID=1891233 RepID=UPI00257E418E|nr:DUF4407 domain-containing protein [Dysgonomonas sp.]MBS7122659.1 DUF4407 domain-containing protein [Dysgonomonas sp.]